MRKGMSAEGAIILVVLAGIVFVTLVVLYNVLFDIGKQEFNKRECQLSLELTRAVDDLTKVWCIKAVDNPIPLQCSRRFITVLDDDVLLEGKSIDLEYTPVCPTEGRGEARDLTDINVDTSSGDFVNQDGYCMAENVLAKEMAECWNTFFEGEFPVFQQVEKGIFDFFQDAGHSRACFVCSEITLKTTKDVLDFREGYLKAQLRDKERSYYEYLARNKKAMCTKELREMGGTCWDGMSETYTGTWWKIGAKDWPGLDQNRFNSGETYAVTFVRQGMSACPVGDASGQSDETIPTMTVQLIPSESMKDYCDMVMV